MNMREAETASIRQFLVQHSDKLTGRVLDLGCGQQPYRDIIEQAGGTYFGWDSPDLPGSVVDDHVDDVDRVGFDAVVMTQVWQYVPIDQLRLDLQSVATGGMLADGGWLLATGPTNWPVVEETDLHRFTVPGVVSLLHDAGFPFMEARYRHHVKHSGETWPLGWAVAARSAQ